MMPPTLSHIRQLLRQAEVESDPARKFAILEDAIDVCDDYCGINSTASPEELEELTNVRRSNIRSLIKHLAVMHGISFDLWIGYIWLLKLHVRDDVKAVLVEDPSLQVILDDFISLHRDQLIRELGADKRD